MPSRYGTFPEPIEVLHHDNAKRLTVRTRFYEVVHDLTHGGAVCHVRYYNGSNRNILVQPMSAGLALADGGAGLSDLHEAAPKVTRQHDGDAQQLRFQGRLHTAGGNASSIGYDFIYRYGWGYVRVTKRFVFPDSGLSVRRFTVHRYAVRSELSDWGYRPAPEAEPSADPFAFGVLQCGRCRSGDTFDTALHTRFVPRYIVNAQRGREGLEWFASSDLSQWAYQLTGRAGHGSASISPAPDVNGVAVDMSPLSLPRGHAVLRGEYVFDFYHGFPILPDRAYRPFLHTSFRRHDWPAEQEIQRWADNGIRTAHFHHDGDSFDDGLFWRDGTYPPFGPQDMAQYDRVIADCHKHGIRVATYFSNKELHPTTQAYKDHGGEWGRKPTDRGELAHNRHHNDEYGAQMCLRSGWLDFFKQYVDTVLSHHDLDGIYYDWNAALYCQNPLHAPGKHAAPESDLGAIALSPAGHWDMDELVELMEWTRDRVGRRGMVIVHNTMVPCAAIENFADHVVAMEWGYGKLSHSAPWLDDLPLEWDFLGGRPRGVIARNCIATGGDPSIERQLALRGLVTGPAPWPATEVASEVFAPLRDYDLGQYRFYPWNRHAVLSDKPVIAGAAYDSNASVLLVVANFSSKPQSGQCWLSPSVIASTGLPKEAMEGMDIELPPYGKLVKELKRRG